ncbi:MAG: Npt1/Npt2 family nucleotide transporter [Alphaproteobacteria bacterium]|nr:Npt1/Npt2 family nucleotide transporter [Alphaproteobacteria bacterium]
MSKESGADTKAPEFTGWRATLWPIHSYEMKKFIPLAIIMFAFLFNYTVLRDTKDTLVVSAAGAGAITFLKSYCVTPMAVLFVMIYAKLTNTLNREQVFYATIIPFLIFFGLFGFVMYPNIDILHPSAESVAAMHAAAPALSGFIDIYAYWVFSLFYIMSEIWGSAMIALVFWQFANHVVRLGESKRFYGLFAVVGNAALLLSGETVDFCSAGITNWVPEGVNPWQFSLNLLMGAVLLMGFVGVYTYRWMHTNVLNDKLYFDPDEVKEPKKKKEKLGLVESFKMIIKSKELLLIATLIMAYGVTINLVEVQWKHQLSLYTKQVIGDVPGAKDLVQQLYNSYMGKFSKANGLFAIVFGLFVSSRILRNTSWWFSAVLTPFTILIAGGAFFLFVISQGLMAPVIAMFDTTAAASAALLGFIIIVVAKSVKYTLFDPTKEMAYIPLTEEEKTKGKAAVDVIGGRAGKAGGAMVQSWLLIAFATKDVVAIAPIAFGTFVVIAIAWIYAVQALSGRVAAATARRAEEAKSA